MISHYTYATYAALATDRRDSLMADARAARRVERVHQVAPSRSTQQPAHHLAG